MTPSPEDSTRVANSAAFDNWFEGFLDEVLRRHPVDATFLGASQHDHTLPDYSREADADWLARAREMIRTLDAIGSEQLSEAQLYDRIMARGALQLWIWETRAPFFHAGNPVHHIGEAAGGVLGLLEQEPMSDERIAAAIARMQAIPAFLETARRRLRSAPLVWTELAMRHADVAAAYFGDALPNVAGAWGGDQRPFLQATRRAATAFAEHGTWLRTVLADKQAALEPAGTETLDQYLHLGHLLPAAQTPAWWFEYAHAELVETTAELRELAQAIDWRATSRILLERLTGIHPSAEHYDDAFPAVWERCRAIVVGTELVSWPEEPVRFRAISRAEAELRQAMTFPIYRGSPPLAPPGDGRAVYPALDRSLPPDEQERLLRQMNDARILLDVVIRNAGLGRHVPSAWARGAHTRIGRLAATAGATRRIFFCGNAVTDGWACYAAELMEEVGALTPLQRLSEAKRRLEVAARAVADIGMHTGELSLARVARMYRDEVNLPATRALEQAVRDSMHPGVGMAELAGTAGIDELRRAIENRDGAAFDIRAFHDRLLRYGAIPVTLIAASMLEAPG